MPSLLSGLCGVFFAPGRSPFVYSPLLLLAVPGAWLFYKRERTLTLIYLYVALVHAVTVASWHRWEGGISWGSRLLTPILPVLVIFVAAAIDQMWRRKWIVGPVVALALAGLFVQVVSMLRNPMRIIVEDVAPGRIQYEDTIHSVGNSWLVLQVQSLHHWQPCDLDSYTLRQWWGNCPP